MMLYITSKGKGFALVNTPTQRGITTPFGQVKALLSKKAVKQKNMPVKKGASTRRPHVAVAHSELPPIVA